MGYEQIIQTISTVGFPIFTTLALGFIIYKLVAVLWEMVRVLKGMEGTLDNIEGVLIGGIKIDK